MQRLIIIILAVAGLVFGDGISFPQKTDPDPALGQEFQKTENATIKEALESEESAREMVHHVANIGLKTVRYLLTGEKNIVISPLNIYSSLGILELGAGGETKEELRGLLGPPNTNQSIKEIVSERNGLSYASAVFLDQTFDPKPSFLHDALTEYEASVVKINASDGEAATNSINRWVYDHTNGTIENILQKRLDSNTRMVILSALLFKGKWLHPFPVEVTTVEKFYVNENSTVEVPFMKLIAKVPVIRNVHFNAISLPYQDEHGLTMHVVLPKEEGASGLKKLLSHLNANSLKKLRTDLTVSEAIIALPKTKIKGMFYLMNSLKFQGVESMFYGSTANFTGITEENGLYVSEVLHGIHFEMDEEGTVAAAITASLLTKSASKHFIFHANRPFLFVITDQTDLVLFIGAVNNPK